MMRSLKTSALNRPARGGGESGCTLVFLAIALFPIVALIALSIDGYSLTVSRLEQENNAEFAAVAALNEGLDEVTGTISLNQDSARKRRAELIAGSNSYLGNRAAQPVKTNEIINATAGSLVSGFYDREQRRFLTSGACSAGGRRTLNAVRLSLNTVDQRTGRASSRMLPVFAKMFGYESFSMRSNAIAYRDSTRKLTAVAPHDASVSERDLNDVNGDGNVNNQDFQTLTAFMSTPEVIGSGSSVSANGRECYDIDGNGLVNGDDLGQLQAYINRRQT